MTIMPEDQPLLFSITNNGTKYIAVNPSDLEHTTIKQLVSQGRDFQMLVRDGGELFKYGTVSKPVSAALRRLKQTQLQLIVQAKTPLYFVSEIFSDVISIRLPHSADELDMLVKSGDALLFFACDAMLPDYVTTVTVTHNYVPGIVDVTNEPLIIKSNAATESFTATYDNIASTKKYNLWKDRFPMYRDSFISVIWKPKNLVLDMILERIRLRFEEKRTLNKIKPSLVATPNLDHLRLLVEEKDHEFQQAYAHSFMQVPDGYPPLVRFANESIGYKPAENVTGVDLFVGLMNRIGNEDLPFTVYFVGGYEQTPYKLRDYFVSLYPNLAQKIVGISQPPVGFLNMENVYTAITEDINKKQPDFVFACLSAPHQEKFIYRMMKQGINFGLGFGLGRTFDLFSGYQKREPKLIEKLHLSSVFRALSNKRYAKRWVQDMRFAIQSVLRG